VIETPGEAGFFHKEEPMIGRAMKFVIGAAISTVFVVGVVTLATPTQAFFGGNCICPDIVAPVKCSNGVTYINSCRASCAHAKDCVRTGDI
jgi:hypothetical protein